MKRQLQLYRDLRFILTSWFLVSMGLFFFTLYLTDKNLTFLGMVYALSVVVVFGVCEVILNELRWS